MERCQHSGIQIDVSTHATSAGFVRIAAEERAAATTNHGRSKRAAAEGVKAPSPFVFPAPLILPGDDLALDPSGDPQSLLAWTRLKERNEVTRRRKTLYLAAAPTIAKTNSWIQELAKVALPNTQQYQFSQIESLTQGVFDYLKAFYHGLPIKILDEPLEFVPWSKRTSKDSIPEFIGLQTSKDCTGIRARACPDASYPAQLNLDDLLEVAISILPPDAYALLMLVDHDIYESDDDDFCCGRAYGGSRIAVVSCARYNPCWDEQVGIDRLHAWPTSHCDQYVRACVDAAVDCEGNQTAKLPKRRKKMATGSHKAAASMDEVPLGSSMQRAITSCATSSWAKSQGYSSRDVQRLWLARVCKTASHELGHCFAFAHCVYYACIMQSTAGLCEDARQPPYLCPVDLAKLLKATGVDERERYLTLVSLCESEGFVAEPMFRAYAAWIRALPIMQQNDARQGDITEPIVID